MTPGEWAEFTGRLEATFVGGLPDDREDELRRHFGRVPFDVAERCIERLVHDGQTYVPLAGALVGALRHVTHGQWEFQCALAGQTSDQRLQALNAAEARRLGRGDRDA